MTIAVRSATTAAWREALTGFLRHRRGAEVTWPSDAELSARQSAQRRVSGGVMLQFLEYIASEQASDHYPVLDAMPLHKRIFVFVTDLAGVVAARDLIAADSAHAIWALQGEWRGWLNDPLCDSDDAFTHHYECWSVWHQEVDPTWGVEPPAGAELWVHEEGWAVADGAGRGAQNVWGWDGVALTLITQDVTSWVG